MISNVMNNQITPQLHKNKSIKSMSLLIWPLAKNLLRITIDTFIFI